jgi:hypothetical protein
VYDFPGGPAGPFYTMELLDAGDLVAKKGSEMCPADADDRRQQVVEVVRDAPSPPLPGSMLTAAGTL